MKYLFFSFAIILVMISGNNYAQVSISATGSEPDNSSILDVKATDKGLLIPRMTQSQRLAIPSPATGLMVFQTDLSQGFYFYNGSAWTTLGGGGSSGGGHYVGELYGGGVVFWVDNTGEHGLVCSMIDLSSTQEWSNVVDVMIGTSAQSDWDGQTNSASIIAQENHSSSAAKLCDDYENDEYGTGQYTDWYLPAIDQMSLLYMARYLVTRSLETDSDPLTTPLVKAYYWSSTEFSAIYAWVYDYYSAYPTVNSKAFTTYVRAIRSF